MPKKNVDYETFQFRQASQKSDETVDQFVTRLHQLAKHCEFTDLNKELKLAVIQNCTSKRLRRYALRDDMTLDKVLAKAQTLESSEAQAKGMEESAAQSPASSSESVKFVRGKRQHPRRQTQPRSQQKSSTQCRQCGLAWPHTKNPCPARGKTCNKCGKPNHFAKMCFTGQTTTHAGQGGPRRRAPNRSAQVNTVSAAPAQDEQDSSSDDEYIHTLGHEPGKMQVPEINVEINGIEMKMLIDTGASTDIIDEEAFRKISQTRPVRLEEDTCRIFAYGSQSRLAVLGKFKANIGANGKQVTSTIHVLQGTHGSLLSFSTANKLGLVDVKISNATSDSSLIDQYPSVFQGIGKLKNYEASR